MRKQQYNANGKTSLTMPLGRPRRKEDNIKMDPMEICCEDVDWIKQLRIIPNGKL